MIAINRNVRDYYDQRHGGCFDRGSADSYYGRAVDPHYYLGGTGSSERVTKLNSAELDAYMAGYEWNELYGDKKNWL